MLPNDADSVRVAQIAAGTAETDHGMPGRGDPDPRPGAGAGRARRARAGPHLRPGRPRDDRDRPARPPGRGHRRGQAGDHHGRPVRARRRARRRSPATSWSSATTSTTVAADVLDRLLGGGGELVTLVAGAEARRGWPSAAPPTSRSSTPLSTSWCTTVARSATRSSCRRRVTRSAAVITLDSPVETVLGDAVKTKRKAHRRGPRPRHRRRPAAPLPAPLRRDRRADRGRATSGEGQLLTVVGEIAQQRASRPTTTAAPAARPTASRPCSAPTGRRCG